LFIASLETVGGDIINYFVSLSDANLANPTVYATIDIDFFSDIMEIGSLSEFFRSCLSEDEFDEDLVGE
jgi:hypothetical protein